MNEGFDADDGVKDLSRVMVRGQSGFLFDFRFPTLQYIQLNLQGREQNFALSFVTGSYFPQLCRIYETGRCELHSRR